jgi:hypothetical protein
MSRGLIRVRPCNPAVRFTVGFGLAKYKLLFANWLVLDCISSQLRDLFFLPDLQTGNSTGE